MKFSIPSKKNDVNDVGGQQSTMEYLAGARVRLNIRGLAQRAAGCKHCYPPRHYYVKCTDINESISLQRNLSRTGR